MDDSILLKCSIPNLFYHLHDRLERNSKQTWGNFRLQIDIVTKYFRKLPISLVFTRNYANQVDYMKLMQNEVTEKKYGSWILSKNCIHGSIEFPLALSALQIVKSTLSLVKAKNIVIDIYLCSRNRRDRSPTDVSDA